MKPGKEEQNNDDEDANDDYDTILQSHCLTVWLLFFMPYRECILCLRNYLPVAGFCFADSHSYRGFRVLDEGLATVWNAKNPSRVIVAGDRILEVNGESISPEDWNVDAVLTAHV